MFGQNNAWLCAMSLLVLSMTGTVMILHSKADGMNAPNEVPAAKSVSD